MAYKENCVDMSRIKILNVALDNISQNELLKQLKQGVLVTPNVDQIVKMQYDKETTTL